VTVARILRTEPADRAWADRVGTGLWYHWARHEAMLRGSTKWQTQQVDSVAAESLRILRKLPDPNPSRTFQARGLVVGYVQSGKTANYTALAARAVDAGYRIVIVLSGIHESLRTQTQNRLERELTGHQPGGVGQAEVGHEWIALTRPGEDFRDIDVRTLQSPSPFLIVAKKHTTVLRKLDTWLESAARFLADKPVLLIDDEADQASINTRGNRDSEPEDDEEEDKELAPSVTNGLIRQILGRAPMAAYVAYTATPFANILIDPAATDRLVGTDLFPRDFVIQLPRPSGYTGTEELFGVSANGRQVLRAVPDPDAFALRGAPRRKRSAEITLQPDVGVIPSTLTDAVLAFFIAGGIRVLRSEGARLPAHTMLVHVSVRTQDQARVAKLIEVQLGLWRAAADQGQDLRPMLLEAWRGMQHGVDSPHDDNAIVEAALSVLKQAVVLVLNSETGEELDYEANPGRHLIAVGGNRLSRGLTLEGLTISYFLRTAAMADTLLQMARWYGFRRGYDDLIRIWTTDGVARWFGELALVEQAMRDSIQALERAGRRPDQMAIRLRAHSELLLTAKNKSSMAVKQRDSWSGDHPQTILLPLGEPGKLVANRNLVDELVKRLSPRVVAHGGLLARDVQPETVIEFLRSYQVHDEIVALRPRPLADWIEERAEAEELTDWTVFVASPEGRTTVSLGGRSVGLVERTRSSSESIGTLLDPRHEGVDLPGGPSAYRREAGTYDSEAMRSARPATQGLLIIYPLDPAPLGVADASIDTVIAIAVSLPNTSDEGVDWIVNEGVVDV
jgi:hypothetical protein